jgi:hypothetical protein
VEGPCEHGNEPWASIKGRFLANRKSVSFSRRALLHVISSSDGRNRPTVRKWRGSSGNEFIGR